MYVIDMVRGFHQLDQGGTDVLKARLFNVFGREIPVSTYHDQRRHWRALTQMSSKLLVVFLLVYGPVFLN